jgi:capping protein alpha
MMGMCNTDADSTDIKSLTLDSNPDIVNNLAPAFEKYNEEQFVTVKLPGSSQPVGDQQSRMDMRNQKANLAGQVIISSYNSLGDGRYFDVESSSSFVFDHTTQVGCP